MEKQKSKMRQIVEFLVVFVVAFTFIIAGNIYCDYDKSGSDAKAVSAKVIKITDIQDEYFEGTENTVITFRGEIVSGEYKGQVFDMIQNINSVSMETPDPVEVGDRVLVTYGAGLEGPVGDENWYYFQQDRIPGIICLAAVFLVLLVVVGRMKGFTTIVSLGFAGAAVFAVYIPAILSGKDIYLTTIVITIFIIFASLTLLNGINKKTVCAIVGNVGGIVATAIIAVVVNASLKITGMIDESFVYLAYSGTDYMIDLRAIMWSCIIIGSLGAIMDVSMSIASAMQELAYEMKEPDVRRMIRSGMNIGRDAIGTMTTTLVLAYTGSSIASIMLYMVNGRNLIILMNLEVVVVEIVQAIVGSIGILLAVPITVIFAAWAFNRGRKE